MIIEKDKVVKFSYTLSDSNQQTLERSDEGMPMTYLHGHDDLLSGLEMAMEGKQQGDHLDVTLEPKDAYGEIDPDAEQRVSIKYLHGAKKWKPGMIAELHGEHERRQVKLIKVGKFMATIDLNHPFAGKTLTFGLDIMDVRDASAEELAHGHVHGEGGHHH